jgi:hypothetical protein
VSRIMKAKFQLWKKIKLCGVAGSI